MLDPRFCSMLEVFMNLTNAPCWKFRFLPCLLVGMQLIVSGCELDGLSSSSDSGSAVITMNELNEVAVEPPASANRHLLQRMQKSLLPLPLQLPRQRLSQGHHFYGNPEPTVCGS